MEQGTMELRLEVAQMKWDAKAKEELAAARKEAHTQGYEKGKGEGDVTITDQHAKIQDLSAQVLVLQKEKERLEKLLA